jgi:hypothetical protein
MKYILPVIFMFLGTYWNNTPLYLTGVLLLGIHIYEEYEKEQESEDEKNKTN